jgi:hypothetical protein
VKTEAGHFQRQMKGTFHISLKAWGLENAEINFDFLKV